MLALGAYAATTAIAAPANPDNLHTATPIKHLVIIYGEKVSFDHDSGTCPQAANPAGEPEFHARPVPPAATLVIPGTAAAAMTAQDEADIIAFLRTRNDGFYQPGTAGKRS